MKDEKKVKLTEEEAKKEVKTEEEGVQLTDEELSSVSAGDAPSTLTKLDLEPGDFEVRL